MGDHSGGGLLIGGEGRVRLAPVLICFGFLTEGS
ncbi:unnamed protein product, partial [marine sediment metagenome]